LLYDPSNNTDLSCAWWLWNSNSRNERNLPELHGAHKTAQKHVCWWTRTHDYSLSSMIWWLQRFYKAPNPER
jgi:hypothetical protein